LARRYGKSKVGIGLGPRSKNPKINAQWASEKLILINSSLFYAPLVTVENSV
jgi:hypothetical protein